MKRLLVAKIVLIAALTGSAKELRYFNVVPVHAGDVEFTAREVRRQAALGMNAIAVSLSYHPQCTPAKNLLPVHAANFRRLKALLEGSGVEVGVLGWWRALHPLRPHFSNTPLSANGKYEIIQPSQPPRLSVARREANIRRFFRYAEGDLSEAV